MQRILLKYTVSITGAILALLVLHLNFGTEAASVPVSVIFYGWLVFLFLRRVTRLIRANKTCKV